MWQILLLLFCSLSQNATVKELLKSVHVFQGNHKKAACVFFDSRCTGV